MAIELTTTSEGILAEIRSTIGLGVEDTPTFYGVNATGPAGSEIAVIRAGLDDDHKYEFGQGSLGYRYQDQDRQKWSVNNESLVLGNDSLSNRVSFNKIGDGIASISTPDVSDVLTSRFVVTKAGDIGIGTSDPTAKLDVNGTIKGGYISSTGFGATIGGTGGNGTITTGGNNNRPLLNFGPSGDADEFTILNAGGWRVGTSVNSRLELQSNNISSLIISNGKVGVGTGTPSTELHVVGSVNSGGQLTIQSNNGTGASSGILIPFTDSAGTRQAYIYKEAVSGNLVFRNESSLGSANGLSLATNGGDVFIDSSGNVGINTNSPIEKLDIAGNLALRNSTTPTQSLLHSTYTSATSFEALKTEATASGPYRIGSAIGSAGGSNRNIQIGHYNSVGTFINSLSIAHNGMISIGIENPTAYVNIGPGTAAHNTAPLKLTAGTNLTSPEDGAIEYDGTNLYITDSTNSRKRIKAHTNGVTDDIVIVDSDLRSHTFSFSDGILVSHSAS